MIWGDPRRGCLAGPVIQAKGATASESADYACGRHLADAGSTNIRNVEITRLIKCNVDRTTQLCRSRRAAVSTEPLAPITRNRADVAVSCHFQNARIGVISNIHIAGFIDCQTPE